MDFGGILKRAWNVTWRYKILWLFGLLAGGVGGGGSSNYNIGRNEVNTQQVESVSQFFSRIETYLPILIAVAVFFAIVGIGFWILSVAAQGGLVHLVNEAQESREVRASLGWGAGFARWGRVFLLQIVLFFPLALVLVAMGFAVFGPIYASISTGNGPGGASILGACGGIIFGLLLLLVFGFVTSILYDLALRYGVIDDVPAFAAIGRAWSDLKNRFKDIFLMVLIVFAIGIAYSMVVGVVGVVFGIAIALATAGGAYAVAALVGFALFLLLLVPGAVYATYVSSVWTLFFRELTGRSSVQAQAVPAYGAPTAPPMGAPGLVPPPPAAPGQYVPAPPPPPAPSADPGDYMSPPPSAASDSAVPAGPDVPDPSDPA